VQRQLAAPPREDGAELAREVRDAPDPIGRDLLDRVNTDAVARLRVDNPRYPSLALAEARWTWTREG